jgi:hypothetical protein
MSLQERPEGMPDETADRIAGEKMSRIEEQLRVLTRRADEINRRVDELMGGAS